MSSTLLKNPGAKFHYDITTTFEAGLILTGGEIKSLRSGGGSLKSSWGRLKDGSIELINFRIPRYSRDSTGTHEPTRIKKTLLTNFELERISALTSQQRLQIIPLEVFLKGRWAKVRLGLGRARKRIDKRRLIKEREVALRTKKALRRF